jgi:hypothetical protein
MNFLRKSGPLGKFLTRNLLENATCLLKKNQKKKGLGIKHAPQESLRCLTQDTGLSKLSAATAKKLLKLRPYEATVVHALQSHVPVNGLEG